MRFGYMHLMPYTEVTESGSDWPVANWRFDPETGADLYDAYLESMALAEQCGFDWVGCNEHHMSPFGLMANPNIIASALIQRTAKISIAVVGNLIPLLNPIRVAEEYAMLDVMSRGRLIAGFLRGIPHEYIAYNVAPDESRRRLDEAIRLIKKAWTSREPFGWEGEFYQFRAVSIWPRPCQKPHPRMLMSGSTEEAAASCAEHGAMLGIASLIDLDKARQLIDVYRKEARARGWEATDDDILVGVTCNIDADAERAKEALTAGRHFFGKILGGGIRTAQKLVVQKTRYFGDAAPPFVDVRQMAQASVDDLVKAGVLLCGTPQDVVEQITNMKKALGHGRMNLNFKIGNVPNDQIAAGLKAFGAQIQPRVANL